MENLKEMKKKIDHELGKLRDKELQANEWEMVFKSAQALYYLSVVCAMEEAEKNGEKIDPALLASMMTSDGVSMRGDYRGTGRAYYPVDMSFGRMPSNNNYDNGNSYNGSRNGNSYSGNSYHGSMTFEDQLRQMMNSSQSMEQREAARMLINSMQNGRGI